MTDDARALYSFKRPPLPPTSTSASPSPSPSPLVTPSTPPSPRAPIPLAPLPLPTLSSAPASSSSRGAAPSEGASSSSPLPTAVGVSFQPLRRPPAPRPPAPEAAVPDDADANERPHKRARLADTTTTTAEGDTAAASALPLPVLLERALVVHERQRQNPLLHYIAHVRIDFSTAPATDFVMSAHASALFLSLRYHLLRPDYIAQRIAALAPAATAAAPAPRTPLTLLLLVVDAPESQRALRELNALALQHGLTLIVCANNREAARYLETYRAYAHKSADAIKGSAESTPYARYAECVTTVRAVSSTDALTLAKQFGSLRTLITASPEQLVLCPGFGAAKVRQMQRAFTQPLRTLSTAPPLPRLLDKDKSAALPEPAAPAPMAKSGAAKRALLKAWATRARDAPQNTPQPRDEGGAASGNA